jgi:protease-4
MGGLRQALEEARALGGLAADAPIVEVPVVEQTLLEKALDLAGLGQVQASGSALTALPDQVRDVVRAVAPMALYRGDEPLARIEWAPVDEPVGVDP